MQTKFSVIGLQLSFDANRHDKAGPALPGEMYRMLAASPVQRRPFVVVIGQIWRTLITLPARALAWFTMRLALLCVDLGEALADISIHLTIYTGGLQC